MKDFFLYFHRNIINLFIWPHGAACGILVPRPGIELAPPALGAWSLSHWTAREVPILIFLVATYTHTHAPRNISPNEDTCLKYHA